MCLSIPSKVVSIDKEKNSAIVDTMGVKREVSLDLTEQDDIKVGDYVLIHIGFVMNKIDEKSAHESIDAYKEVIKLIEEDET